jgi:hypothetical protein
MSSLIVYFACQNCDAVHQAIYRRRNAVARRKNCRRCSRLLHEWLGVTISSSQLETE